MQNVLDSLGGPDSSDVFMCTNSFFRSGFFFKTEPVSSKLDIHILIALTDGTRSRRLILKCR